MSIHGVDYRNTEAEYNEVCDFLNALSAIEPNMLWESGRMNFVRHSVHADKDESFFRSNVRTWRTEAGAIVALCISEYGQNDLFIEIHPEHHDLYPAILDWVKNAWAASRDKVEVFLYAEDAQKIAALQARGFASDGHCENKRTYDLNSIDLGYELESGFSIQTLAESGNLEGRVALTVSAFDNPNYTMGRLTGMLASPDHVDDYHLMVISPDGQPVAYCVGWHETAREGFGYIEPVGTHADFRRRGFATAVIQECFARLKANGIHTAEIASGAEPNVSNFLYESLHPATKREVHRYLKHFS